MPVFAYRECQTKLISKNEKFKVASHENRGTAFFMTNIKIISDRHPLLKVKAFDMFKRLAVNKIY